MKRHSDSDTRVTGYLLVSCSSGQLGYCGVSRQTMEVVLDYWYDEMLSVEVASLVASASARGSRHGCWPFFESYSDCDLVLEGFRSLGINLEMLAFRFPSSVGIGQLSELQHPDSFEFWGVDVFSVGEWSLLGALAESGLSQSGLNMWGLLADEGQLSSVVASYTAAAENGQVEAIATVKQGGLVVPIAVYGPRTRQPVD